MIVMEQLEPRQKQEWKTAVDDHWIRTGCHNLWDAVFIAFREYRDATPSSQKEMIRTRTNIDNTPSAEWVDVFLEILKELYKNRKDDEHQKTFFYLLPLKLISSEIIPYVQTYINNNSNLTMEQLHEEIIEKCMILADYRQKKKNLEKPTEEVRQLVGDCMESIFNMAENLSYDTIQQAMANIEHQLIIISPQEDILFDSKVWGEGVEGCEYQDVVIVLAHPDGTYDSIGRLSYTKDGHQKISRLFHYDDDIVEALRK